MSETIFVMGGCRSGKSSHALELAQKIPGHRKLFIATCVPHDDEMRSRVVNHRQERDSRWETAETPVDIPRVVNDKNSLMDVILIDCLTLWISNLMCDRLKDEDIFDRVKKLELSCKNSNCPVILVSNEVGSGIVPENAMARRFRDLAGFTNQRVASVSDEVFWTVAGIPVRIKP